jgi:DedD protein
VQVAALSKREAARELADSLKEQGYRAFVMEYRADGKLFFRVRVGPEPSRESAEVLARRLTADGHKSVVVRHP